MKPRIKWSGAYQKWYAPSPCAVANDPAMAFVIQINRANKLGAYRDDGNW